MATLYSGWQADGSAYPYVSPEAAQAVANPGDTVKVGYSNPYKNTHWFGARQLNADVILEGLLPCRQISFSNNTTLIQTGSNNGTIRNLTLNSTGNVFYSNKVGYTYNIENCFMLGGLTIIGNSVLNIRNNLFHTASTAVYCSVGTFNCNNNTFFKCRYGLYQASTGILIANNNVLYSCGVAECLGIITGSNNAGQDGTLPATGRIDLNSIDPKFVRDNLDDSCPNDFRIVDGSDLQLAGIDVGLTSDMDCIPYVGGFPVGCSFGLPYVNKLLTDATGGNWEKANKTYVLLGNNFGVSGSEVAEYEPDFPSTSDVLNTATVDNVQGKWQIADYTKYQLGEQYGVDGTSLTGEYNPSGVMPSAPTITIVDNEDGTGYVVTISGSDAGTTNTLYQAEYGSTTWTEKGDRVGDGTINVSSLIGHFWAFVTSNNGSKTNAGYPVAFYITDATTTYINTVSKDVADILDDEGIGTEAGTSDWGIYIGVEPKTPANCITVYDTGGSIQYILNLTNPIPENETIQIRIRSKTYATGISKAQEIMTCLDEKGIQVIEQPNGNEVRYDGFHRQQGILYVGRDEKERYLFTLNYRCPRQKVV